VDSGAKNGAICEELLLNRTYFNILPPSKYLFIAVCVDDTKNNL
jgi:hypothetical protein